MFAASILTFARMSWFCRISVWLACGIAMPTSAPLFAQQQSTAEQAVVDGVRRLVEAYGANDLDTYFTIYAEDMTVLRSTGRWTHPGYYESWKRTVDRGGGNRTARFDDLEVQVLPGGEAAVATFRMPVESRFPEGTPARDPQIIYYMTTVWARRNDNWNVVHVHWSVQP